MKKDIPRVLPIWVWLVLALVLLATQCGCNFHKAPSGSYFPHHWGEPPKIQLKDYVLLPDHYGHGSSTLKSWITLNKEKDRLKKLQRDVDNQLRTFRIVE